MPEKEQVLGAGVRTLGEGSSSPGQAIKGTKGPFPDSEGSKRKDPKGCSCTENCPTTLTSYDPEALADNSSSSGVNLGTPQSE